MASLGDMKHLLPTRKVTHNGAGKIGNGFVLPIMQEYAVEKVSKPFC